MVARIEGVSSPAQSPTVDQICLLAEAFNVTPARLLRAR
jgi:hypothetical protein